MTSQALSRLCWLIALALTPVLGRAQPSVRSPYLQNPGTAVGYVDSCARFWFSAYDPVAGGFYTNIDRQGLVITASGTNKNMISQSRDAYGFVRGFMLTGNQQYLLYARRALDFLYRTAWDSVYGGWFQEASKNGLPLNITADKSAFNQHYALLGPAAMVEATDDSVDRSWLLRGFQRNENIFWDSRAAYFGYYDHTRYDGSTPDGKSFNATVDAITTHVLPLYLMTGEATYKTRLLQIADNMVNRLTESSRTQAIGFIENYTGLWMEDYTQTMTIMGHVLKTAWCLARVYTIQPDTSYLGSAERLVDMVLTKGYDTQNGGPYKDYTRTTGAMLMWGQKDTAKAWWQMEQAVTAGLLLYDLTGKPKYLKMADETLEFFMKYFVDHTYGEVYENRTKYGTQIWDTNKGGSGKAGYHSTELGYYVYLYGKLLLNRDPATLYYSFAPVGRQRALRLSPLTVRNDFYRIDNVTLSGVSYTSFDGANRLLTIPAGVGGTFAVTYVSTAPQNSIAGNQHDLPVSIQLDQNFPNPFNGSTVIRFHLPAAGTTHLEVYNVLGARVAILLDEELSAGEHSVAWDGRASEGRMVASGMYICRLMAPDGMGNRAVSTRTMAYVR
jgi:mannose/cellobiose epimerase-like protein (N-acyl-D-glucosamine 2-epimerase family)